MSRVEDNKALQKELYNIHAECTYDEAILVHFRALEEIMIDISKSLAVIADSMSREDGDAE